MRFLISGGEGIRVLLNSVTVTVFLLIELKSDTDVGLPVPT